jgi:hypothetical protein
MYDGIEFIARLERCSKRKAAIKVMEDGLSRYMSNLVKEQIKLDNEALERHEKIERTRFRFLIRKYARENGLKIKGII